MTDYRRPSQTNKQRMVGSTSRGLEGLLAILAQRGQLVPNAAAKFGPSYRGAIDATSQGIGDMAATGQGLRNSFYTTRGDLYGNIDQMSGLQDQADEMFANQQAASNQAYARGQQEYARRRKAIEQANAGSQAQSDMYNQVPGLMEILSAQTGINADAQLQAISNMIARLQDPQNPLSQNPQAASAIQALIAIRQQLAQQAMQQGPDATSKMRDMVESGKAGATQSYDAAREKAADLIQQLMGN